MIEQAKDICTNCIQSNSNVPIGVSRPLSTVNDWYQVIIEHNEKLDKLAYILMGGEFDGLREPEYGGAFWVKSNCSKPKLVYITKIIYSAPAIIAFFSDGDKIVAKAQGSDNYDVEKGLMVIMLKKLMGSAALSKLIDDWTVYDNYNTRTRTLADVRKDHRKK